jgi:hypothetical protein
MKKICTILFLIIAAITASCRFERYVDIDILDIEPHLVLNSLLFTDRDSGYFYVTKSRSTFTFQYNTWWGSYKDKFEYIEDADFHLFINDVPYQLNYSKKDSAYIYPSELKPGDNIEIVVNQKEGELRSETTLPAPLSILSVDTVKVNRTIFDSDRELLRFKVRIKDDPDRTNYYRLIINEWTSLYGGSWYSPQYYTEDPALTQGMPNETEPTDFDFIRYPTNELSVFRDKLFEGKEYTLTFYIDYPYAILNGEQDEEGSLSVKLQSITEDLYNYYFTIQRNKFKQENDYNEPIVIFSNIRGGLGILGACSEVTAFHFEKNKN